MGGGLVHCSHSQIVHCLAASKACLLCYLVKVGDHSACFPIILLLYETNYWQFRQKALHGPI